MTQNANYLLLTYTKQLLLATFYDTISGIELVLGHTHRRIHTRSDKYTDRQMHRYSNVFLTRFILSACLGCFTNKFASRLGEKEGNS